MSTSVTLRPMTPPDLPAYRELYESAFPPSERKELSFMLEGEMAAAYDVLVIETPGTPVAGLIISVRHGDFIMLDYLAIRPNLRGQGIGHAAMPQIIRYCRSHAPGKHIFFEIETPVQDCDNPIQWARRLEFYRSCGFVETPVRMFIYGTDMELLAPPEDAPYITREGYMDLLRATFPPEMIENVHGG